MMRMLCLLLALSMMMVNISAQGFCQKYTAALFPTANNSISQNTLVSLVVTRAVSGNSTVTPAVQGVVGSGSPIINFFNGNIIFRANGQAVNFLANGGNNTDFATLAQHLVGFFGTILGCEYGSNGTSTNMYSIHQRMGITQAQEDYFNLQVANSMLSFGVAQADIPDLSVFGRCAPYILGNPQQICGTSTCTLAPNANCNISPYNSASSMAPSVMIVAAVFAVISLLL